MALHCDNSATSSEELQRVTPDKICHQTSKEPSFNNSTSLTAGNAESSSSKSQPNSNESIISEAKADDETNYTLKDLPNEVLIKIFSFLSLREVLKISRVCWNFNLLSKDISIWRHTEAEISCNEDLQSFCRCFRLCYLFNTRENTTIRHPYKALSHMFSYLSKEEILEASIAIWKFDHQSKNSSMWQMIKLLIRCEDKLKAIFSVMDQVTPIKCLSLVFRQREHSSPCSFKKSIFYGQYKRWKFETSELNEIFKQSKQLYCLNLQNLELSSIILPPTVKHISISLNYGLKTNDNPNAQSCVDAVSQLSLLRNCPNTIEHLGIYANRRYVELNKSIKDLLIKFQLSLTSVHIDTLHTNEDLHPLIKNCYKLEELGLYLYGIYDPENLFSSLDISQFPNLKSFTLKTENFHSYSTHIFHERGFSNLTYFHINCEQSHLRKVHFKILLSCLPNLETFLYNAHLPYRDGTTSIEEEPWENIVIDFCEYIKNCITLKHIGMDLSSFHNKPKAFLVKKMIPLQKQRHYESVCLCKIIFNGPNGKLFHAKELCKMLKGLCKTCMYLVDESYKCSCWKHGRGLRKVCKRQLDYEHVSLNTLEVYDQLIDRELAANEGRVHSVSHFASR